MKTRLFLLLLSIVTLTACTPIPEAGNKEYLGNPDAQTEIQIYSDLECPACAKASNFTDVLLKKYSDEIKISYHHFPLESIHEYAFGAAVAAECAGEQGKMWKYIKYVYKFQEQLDTQNLKKHALNVGLDTEAFDLCVDNQATAEIVKADLRRSQRLGIKGTPTFAINGEIVELGTSPDEMLILIDEAVETISE